MSSIFPYRLYLVVSQHDCLGRDIVWVTEQAVKGGVDVVQLREKHLSTANFTTTALRLKAMLDSYDVPLIINDNLEVAKACGAAGIHVGTTDIAPSKIKALWPQCGILGYSIEHLDQLYTAEVEHADYLGISPVYSTPTKTDTVTEWGLEGILTIRGLTGKPLIAIGSMNVDNARNVVRAGADCIAVVSAICGADDPAKAAHEIRTQIEKAL